MHAYEGSWRQAAARFGTTIVGKPDSANLSFESREASSNDFLEVGAAI
jgi:hypothetical protein